MFNMFNMFWAKPFGTPFAASTSTFGTSTPFGTSAGFSTPGFGSNTPAPTGGLFGQNTSSSTATGLFGGGQQTTTFGSSQNTGFTFGSTPSASGGLFGQNNQSTGAGLFATPVSNTAFGAKTPGFSGFAATGNAASTGSTFFGAQSSGSSLFGQPSGFASTATSGTKVKFNPPNGQDTIVKNGFTININTKHQCITAMKEYENKSIEELRLEDYVANRKGKQQQAVGSLFGTTPATQTTGFNFGGAGSGTGFGASGFSATGNAASTGSTLFGTQSSGSSLFGQPSGFASTATSGTTVKFNPPNGQDTIVKNGVTTNINTKHQCITAMKEYENKSIEELRLEDYVANRKGKQQQAVGSLFGTTPATQTTGFSFGGAGSGTGFGASVGFGTSTGTSLFGQQQSTSLFGQQNKTGFGTTTAASTGLGFGTITGTGTSLFGQQQKPVGLFGANPVTTQSSLFGAGTSFGSTSTFQPTAFGTSQQQNTSLFSQKLPAFGTSTAGSTGFSFNAGSSQGSSNLFAKPLSNSTFTGFNTASTATIGFGFVPSSTSAKLNPPSGEDTIVKNGVTINIKTKHQCITAMKEYENKSLEELRLEDYTANQKDKQQRAGDTLFGTTSSRQARGFSLGGAFSGTGFRTSDGCAISTRSLAFGQKQKQATNLFSQQNKLSLGTTTTNSACGFGTSTDTVTSLFIEQQKQKLTGLLGQKPSFGTCTIGSKGISLKAVSQESSNLFCKSLANTFSSSSTASTSTVGFQITTTETKPKCMDAGSQTDFGESTVAEIKPKCMDAGSQTDLRESTVAEIKPKCMDAGSQTDLRESAVAEIKQKCMDAGSQTDLRYFARELTDTYKSTIKSKETSDPIPGKSYTSMIFSGMPSVDGTLHPSIFKSKQFIMPRPSSFVACEVCTRSFASLSVMPNDSSNDSLGTENMSDVANSTAEEFGNQTITALPKATTQNGVAADKISHFTPTVTTQLVLSEAGTSSDLPTTLGGLPTATVSPCSGTIINALSGLSICGGGLPTNTSSIFSCVTDNNGVQVLPKPLVIVRNTTVNTGSNALTESSKSNDHSGQNNFSTLSGALLSRLLSQSGPKPSETKSSQKIKRAVRKIRR